jgi:hypothetical protein
MGSLSLFPRQYLPSACLIAGSEIDVVVHAKRGSRNFTSAGTDELELYEIPTFSGTLLGRFGDYRYTSA